MLVYQAMNPLNPFSNRLATLDDLPALVQLDSLCAPNPWTETQFHEELNRKFARILVMTDDDTDSVIAAYLVYWLQAEAVSLLNLGVGPNWRGLGFARRLIQTMIKEAVREDIPKVVLEVRESNMAAIRLYHSIGFQDTHRRESFYSDGESARIMELKTSEVSPQIH